MKCVPPRKPFLALIRRPIYTFSHFSTLDKEKKAQQLFQFAREKLGFLGGGWRGFNFLDDEFLNVVGLVFQAGDSFFNNGEKRFVGNVFRAHEMSQALIIDI
jgi:hypothetical protein